MLWPKGKARRVAAAATAIILMERLLVGFSVTWGLIQAMQVAMRDYYYVVDTGWFVNTCGLYS
jgi:hypothetical protein